MPILDDCSDHSRVVRVRAFAIQRRLLVALVTLVLASNKHLSFFQAKKIGAILQNKGEYEYDYT